ncbi:MAG: beta-propeller domain-containing protein, partial [Actinomycetota bacterium]
LTLLATACSNDDPIEQGDGDPDATPTPVDRNDDGEVVVEIDGDELVLTSGLSGFGDCDALLAHLRTEAAERVGPYGLNGGGWYGGPIARGFDTDEADMAEEADFAVEDSGGDHSASFDGEATSASAGAVEGVDFSGTNVQEVGVDEADIIKTDGERIFLVAANQLVVIDAAEREVIGAVDLPQSWRTELFLAGDELLVVGSAWLEQGFDARPAAGGDAEAGFAEDIAIEEPWYGANIVRLTRVSIDGGDIAIADSTVIEGEYVSARAVDGVARVVVRSNPQQNFPFVYPAGPSGEDIATEANRAAVLQSELSDWLPSYGVDDGRGGVVSSGLLPDCSSVHAPTEFAGFGVLSVVSVPVDGSVATPDSTSVLAPGSTVYASTESVFVATQTWPDLAILEDDENAWEKAWEARHTSIHRFALSDTGAAYTASGSVPGDLRNQFSLSEYDGHLRVVTTSGDTWDETSESFVRVLRETDGELIEVGSVGNMGNGEAVQSVRFVGEVGYVVTFRQIDPFYTLDLRDPENPRVVGELKIPGFSSYLHPIGEGRVLGVGSDADLDGRVTGSKVSIFDVSDPANPEEVAIWSAPGGWNDIGWEHRSFLWWAPEQLAVIPVNVWQEGWSGAIVLKVDGTTIEEVGRIDHIDEATGRGETDCDVITSEDLPSNGDENEFESEFEWIVDDEWSRVILCDEGQTLSVSGFQCYEDEWIADEAARMGFDIPEGSTLAYCWDNGNQSPVISRSMVIDGDEIWTLSSEWGWPSPEAPAQLQVNDLGSLERIGRVNVG